jgi:dihydrodipicolinate synthase/N-acetylneuraminate lyase
VDAHIDVLVPCGTTGEAATMTEDEQKRVVAITLEEAGKVPVLAGAGSNDTQDRGRAVQGDGRPRCAHGILSVGPVLQQADAGRLLSPLRDRSRTR